MAVNPHRVTAEHIHGLAVADRMHTDRACLVDTDKGIRLVTADYVLAEDSTVRRMLLTRTDLIDGVHAANTTMSAYLKAHAGRIAAELNAVMEGAR